MAQADVPEAFYQAKSHIEHYTGLVPAPDEYFAFPY